MATTKFFHNLSTPIKTFLHMRTPKRNNDFETLYPWDSAVWEYLGEHYATDVFTKFDSAQATLVDLEEEDEKGEDEQPSLGEALQ